MNRVCSTLTAAAVGAIAAIAYLSCAHQSSQKRAGRPSSGGPQSLNRWEGEGGSVPDIDEGRLRSLDGVPGT
ncbi:hypothetical protein ACDA63_16235 [Uliginosibacterium sp. sgz301328]|uniref:hypothetical protein n=1 Tax=Uliginosibacterium sp. sgz301328 TaxID=3243764 RepID=UPI00359EBAAC